MENFFFLPPFFCCFFFCCSLCKCIKRISLHTRDDEAGVGGDIDSLTRWTGKTTIWICRREREQDDMMWVVWRQKQKSERGIIKDRKLWSWKNNSSKNFFFLPSNPLSLSVDCGRFLSFLSLWRPPRRHVKMTPKLICSNFFPPEFLSIIIWSSWENIIFSEIFLCAIKISLWICLDFSSEVGTHMARGWSEQQQQQCERFVMATKDESESVYTNLKQQNEGVEKSKDSKD